MLTNLLRIILSRSFKPFVFEGGVEHDIDYNVENPGIYVHIPFCKTICSFCPYNKETYKDGTAKRYINALIKEIRQSRANASGDLKEVYSIYFGGGSPALLVEYLGLIILEIKNMYKIKGSIGVELHPRDITESTVSKLREYGVDMVSIGIQSFQRKCLMVLGREETDMKTRFNMLKNAGFKAIDVDLIFGIPGQNIEDLKKDFITAVKYGATQISTYPFIDFSYANNLHKPLGRREKREMLKGLLEVSSDMGYVRTSVWTFAKTGTPKYSSVTRENFIGFGPSATTLLKKVFKINTFSVEEYIKCVHEGKSLTALSLEFTERTRALYWLFWSSYCLDINNDSFRSLFGKDVEDLFGLELLAASKLGYLSKTRSGYTLTEKGAYLFHLIEQVYTHQYIDKTWSIAGKHPWPEKIVLY